MSIVLLSIASGCASVTPVPSDGSEGNNARRQYSIDCFELDECKELAAKTCGAPYDVVSEWHNDIPESEFPGLNEQSRVKDSRDWNRITLPRRDGFESDSPMPLATIVVACHG